jgi:preprotein translocase subunit YajC
VFFVHNWGALLPFALIALVFWLLIVRPQRRRQQSMQATQSSLRLGSEVMLGSGIYGKVASVDDEDTTILVEIAPGTAIKVARQAVVRVIEPETGEPPTAERLDDSPAEPDIDPDDRPGPDDQRP